MYRWKTLFSVVYNFSQLGFKHNTCSHKMSVPVQKMYGEYGVFWKSVEFFWIINQARLLLWCLG